MLAAGFRASEISRYLGAPAPEFRVALLRVKRAAPRLDQGDADV